MIAFSKNKRYQKVKETFLEWSSRTDINNYRKIFEYKGNFLAQIIWTIIFFGLGGLTVALIQMSISAYFTFSVTSTYDLCYENPAEFPTITLCSSNPFLTQQAASLLTALAFNYSLDLGSEIKDIVKLAKMFAANPEYGDENRKLLGLSIDNIVSCQFNNKDCKEDLHWIWLFDYGNCFQFNAGRNYLNRNIDLAKMSRTEPNYGLNIVFNILNREYALEFLNDQGYLRQITLPLYDFVSFVHNSSNRISSTTKFIYFKKEETKLTFSVRRKFIYKQAWPYSDCIDLSSYSSDYYNFLLHSNYSYRQLDCLDLCIQQEIMNECKCYDLRYPKLNNQTKPCLNLTEYNCAEIEINNFVSSACIRDSCPLECDSVNYAVQNSVGAYNFQPYVFGEFGQTSFEVFYSSLQFTAVTESPQTTFINLLTQLGGSLGMFASFSVFSLFETLEIFILIIYSFFVK